MPIAMASTAATTAATLLLSSSFFESSFGGLNGSVERNAEELAILFSFLSKATVSVVAKVSSVPDITFGVASGSCFEKQAAVSSAIVSCIESSFASS